MNHTTTLTRRLTTDAAPTPDWEYAACRQVDPELFFPVVHQRGWKTKTVQAKQVCARCPIRAACLEWALSTNQRAGVWGGLSEEDRRALARDRTDRRTSYQLCIDEQAFIEKRVAAGASQSAIARELGVGADALRRAQRFFESEKAAAQAVEEVAAV